MSDTYTKLFRSIAASTIVSEPLATRWLWVTMLSQADKAGKVYGSVPGLARMANISLEECEAGLACFLSPDKYSRTAEHEGRRVEAIDGGWKLLNHAKYDAMRSEAERRDYKREWDRTHRSKAAKAESDTSGQSDTIQTDSDKSDASDLSSQFSVLSSHVDQKQDQKRAPAAPTPADLFPDVDPDHLRDWVAARKAKRLPLTETAAKGFRRAADKAGMTAAEAVKFCAEKGWAGLYADTQQGGNARAGPQQAQPVGKQMQGLMALEAMKSGNRMAAGRGTERVAEDVLLVAGPDARG